MKIKYILLMAFCMASSIFAGDVVLDVQLNGLAVEDGHKSGKIMERALLVIEDFGSETNAHAGTLYLLGNKGKGKGGGYETEDVVVNIISGKGKDFALLIQLDDAYIAGTGRVTKDKNGNYSQITISSGHGTFIYANFADPVSTNEVTVVIEDAEIEELGVGKMQAKLNKKLTEMAQEYGGNEVVEIYLDDKGGKKK